MALDPKLLAKLENIAPAKPRHFMLGRMAAIALMAFAAGWMGRSFEPGQEVAADDGLGRLAAAVAFHRNIDPDVLWMAMEKQVGRGYPDFRLKDEAAAFKYLSSQIPWPLNSVLADVKQQRY